MRWRIGDVSLLGVSVGVDKINNGSSRIFESAFFKLALAMGDILILHF